jgi:hypothetical protein
MLPAWATVLIALGGAAIGAVGGFLTAERTSKRAYQSAKRSSELAYEGAKHSSELAFRSSKSSLIHETEEAWRTLLIETCRALSDAWLEFRWLLYPPSREPVLGPLDEEALGPRGTTCAQTVAKARLVFGLESEAGKAAAEVDDKIAQLKEVALAPRPWDEAAKIKIRSCITDAENAHADFLLKANVVIRPDELAYKREYG